MLFNIISWVCIILVLSSIISIIFVMIINKREFLDKDGLEFILYILPIFWLLFVILLTKKEIDYSMYRRKKLNKKKKET